MIVVDTNIVAYFLIDGDRTDQTRQLWQADPDWRLPALWRHEFLNVLTSYARQSNVPMNDIRELWQLANGLFTGTEQEVNMELALELAINKKISSYDAQFVILAQTLKTRLVTEDKVLLRRFPESTISLRHRI